MVFSFPIMIIASVAFVTRALSSTNLLACQPRGSCLLHLLQQYRLVWEAAAYLHIFYHFFFYNNSVFVSQNVIVEERNFCVFTIFRGSQLVFAALEKTSIFGDLGQRLSPDLFDPHCQLTNYSWTTILSWLSLPNDGINYFLMELKIPILWNIIFNCCSFLTLLMWRWHLALTKKFRNLLLPITIPI